MNSIKKAREEYFLLKFFENKDVEIPIVTFDPMETPDFAVKTLNSLVSVEVTQIFNPSLKQMEESQNDIVRIAKEEFLKTRKDNLKVYVTFTGKPLQHNDNFKEKLANELLKFILLVCENNDGLDFRIATKDWPVFHEYFESITISNEFNFENWQPFGGYIVPKIDEQWFASKIEKKEKNIERYKVKRDEDWLLMVAGFGHKSSAFRFEWLENNYSNSKFERIYIFQYFENKVIRVK